MSSPTERVTSEEKLDPIVSFREEDIGSGNVLNTIISTRTGKPINLTGQVDQAMQLALKAEHIELSDEDARRILRKTDLYMMPVMCLLYCFQFMDKTTNSYASVMGLRTELHMVGDMYSWTGTAFYLGYLIFEFPSSFILQRFPVAKTVGVFVMLWGMILALHSVPHYPGFVALRVILGMLESAVTPAFVLITSQWYKKEEQFIRTSIWFAFNGLGTIFGSGVAYGLATHQDSYSMDAWRLVFIITGCITVLSGIVIIVHIPDTPMNAWFLSEEEKLMVVERIRSNKQGFGNKHFKKYQFIEAITDVQVWLLALFALASNIPNGGLTNFGAILLNGDFGYSPIETLLMNMPSGAVELIGCPLFALLTVSIKWKCFRHRMFWAIATTLIVLLGACLLAFSDNQHAKLFGLYIFGIAPVGFICLLSCIASNVAGHTKKVTSNAIYLVFYCVGNIVGPQTFVSKEAPSYTGAKTAIVVCYSIAILTLCGIYYVYWKRNQLRDAADESEFERVENTEFADLTDKENPTFRYAI